MQYDPEKRRAPVGTFFRLNNFTKHSFKKTPFGYSFQQENRVE